MSELPAPLSLRARHVAVTRSQILEVAWRLLVDDSQEPFSHELIAKRAGVGARTVYRHFPRRADLLQALWERVRDETKTKFPSTETEIIPLVRQTFGHFSKHESVVRAALSFSAAPELRSRGSLEGRPAFRRSLAEILNRLPLAAQRRVVAVCLGIWSAPFWQLLRDRGELSGTEAQDAGVWAMEVILNAARTEAGRVPRRKTRKASRKESPR